MKKKEENVFPLPGFPSVSKQFTANGFADNDRVLEEQTTEATDALRAPQAKPPRKGKK